MIKIAINGFGRIGALTAKRMLEKHPFLQLAAVNDLANEENLKQSFGQQLNAKFFAEKDPANLPWKDLGIDLVLECSGFFTEIDGAKKHLLAGAKKVIISAPSDSPEIPTYLLGVNAEKYNPAQDDMISMGSCTTNAVAPVAKILDKHFGVKAGFINTTHSYTNSQNKQYPNWRADPASQLSIFLQPPERAKPWKNVCPNSKASSMGFLCECPPKMCQSWNLFF